MQHTKERSCSAFPGDSPRYVEYDNITGTLPNNVYNTITQQACINPVLHITIPSPHFQRFQCHIFATFWNIVFAQCSQNAQQALVNARVALVAAQHDRVVASYNVLAAIGRLSPQVLGLSSSVYDPMVHYQQVRDAWTGIRNPDGR